MRPDFDPTNPHDLSDAQIDARLGIVRELEPWEINQSYRLKRWYRLRARAKDLVHQAVGRGELARLPDPAILCVECGDAAVYYDHRDYEKPLNVRPVCSKCNNFNHAEDAPVFLGRPDPRAWLDRPEDIEFDLACTLHCCRLT